MAQAVRAKEDSLEKRARKRSRRGAIERAVLGVLTAGGLLTIALAAPKVLSLIKQEHLDALLPPDPRQRLQETASRMKRKGWITFETRGSRKHMRITDKGLREMARIRLGTYVIPKQRRWDQRWRIVIFDIRENRRADRIKLRTLLVQLGFFRLQDSVWVHPYDCEEVITLIKTEFRLGSSTLYIIADAIEFDRPLREHFGLPSE
ncbi:MAG: CRISPR-associated endonuclease Cas2 [Patescibacteria group bacterium]